MERELEGIDAIDFRPVTRDGSGRVTNLNVTRDVMGRVTEIEGAAVTYDPLGRPTSIGGNNYDLVAGGNVRTSREVTSAVLDRMNLRSSAELRNDGIRALRTAVMIGIGGLVGTLVVGLLTRNGYWGLLVGASAGLAMNIIVWGAIEDIYKSMLSFRKQWHSTGTGVVGWALTIVLTAPYVLVDYLVVALPLLQRFNGP